MVFFCYKQVYFLVMVVNMLKRLVLIVVLILINIIFSNIYTFAQETFKNDDLQKVIDINNRLTPEEITQFAIERNLNFKSLPSQEEISKKLSETTYKDFSFIDQKKIGEALLKEFLTSHKLYTSDPLLVKYIALVGKLISSNLNHQMGSTYTYGIIDDPNIKIYSFLGGYIFVTKGYLKAIENEAQLAASLASEIGSIDNNYLLKTLMENQESFSLLLSLKDSLNTSKITSQTNTTPQNIQSALEPFSDPFLSLDYYAAPGSENAVNNENFLTKKLLKKMTTLVPSYETLVEKDKMALHSISKAGYDMESLKDMLLTLNKKQQQIQVVNRSLNIENWLGEKSLDKQRSNKVEGRYVMMVERLNF